MKHSLFIIVMVTISLAILVGLLIWWMNENRNGNNLSSHPSVATSSIELTSKGNKTKLPLKLPEGVEIDLFAENLVTPRVIIEDPNGVLLVSSHSDGRIYALPDKDSDGKADRKITLAQNLNAAHGLALRCLSQDNCVLYVAESDKVVTYDYDSRDLGLSKPRKIVDLPNLEHHYTRTIHFLPPPHDDQLLISVGSTCDQCEESDVRRAAISIVNADGSNFRPYSLGLRNAVFMTSHPQTRQIWVTEMGHDDLGPDLPPDEINILEQNEHFGWPFCFGKKRHDTSFDPTKSKLSFCQNESVSSHIDIPAHSAPLGLAFIPTRSWHKEDQGDLLVAYHGSSHRDELTGYKVVKIDLDENGKALTIDDFITGWLTDEKVVVGRPTGLHVHSKDQSIYMSDDNAGVIYRIRDRRSDT